MADYNYGPGGPLGDYLEKLAREGRLDELKEGLEKRKLENQDKENLDMRFTQKWCCSSHYDGDPLLMPMIVCLCCGNKRCPKATNHELDCTQSNEPGQVGSRFRKDS